MSEVLQGIVIFVKILLNFVEFCSAENQQSASSNHHFCENFVDCRGSGVAAGPRPAFGRPRIPEDRLGQRVTEAGVAELVPHAPEVPPALQHREAPALALEVVREGDAAEPGAQHDHVDVHGGRREARARAAHSWHAPANGRGDRSEVRSDGVS